MLSFNDMQLEHIERQIVEMTEAELVTLNNEFCEANGYTSDIVKENDRRFLDELRESIAHGDYLTLKFMLLSVQESWYRLEHKYVQVDDDGKLNSLGEFTTDHLPDHPVEIADYVISRPHSFSYKFDFLDEAKYNYVNSPRFCIDMNEYHLGRS